MRGIQSGGNSKTHGSRDRTDDLPIQISCCRSLGQTPLHCPSSVFPADAFAKHTPRASFQADSFKFLIGAHKSKASVWIHISSASFKSSVMKSRRTEASCRRWSHFEQRVLSARNSPFMRRMAFHPTPVRWPPIVAPSPAYRSSGP